MTPDEKPATRPEPDAGVTPPISAEVVRKRAGCGRVLAIASLAILAIVVWELANLTSDNGACRLMDYSMGPLAGNTTGRPAGELVVMTYNTEGHAVLLNRNHVQEIARTINDAHPDIVALQEVHNGTFQSRFVDQTALLEKLTGMHGRFGASFHFMGGDFGNAILTRGEILSTRVWALPGQGEPRSLLEATIAIRGGVVNVYVTHFEAWGRLQRRSRIAQAACVKTIVSRSGNPYILMGDLNATPEDPEIRQLRTAGSLLDTLGSGLITHPLTGQRIDYILVPAGWKAQNTHVLHSGPSDHWPVVSTLQWTGADERTN
ncbi:MAG: endonuclease/exonuclease/phosphatase family protein [Acidobacteriota bacterium]